MAAGPEEKAAAGARPEKVAVVDEVRDSLNAAAATILTDYRGLSVGELAELRIELRKANATYKVAKNTLMRRAADEAEIGISGLMFGPTALVFCEDDPVGPAKALKAFAKDHPELLVKGSWLDGELLDAEATVKLADLESREDLLARLAGLMHGALANTARLLNAAPAKLARLLAALEHEGGVEAKGFSPTAPTEQAPAAEAEQAPAADAAEDTAQTAAETVEDAGEAAAETVEDAGEAAAETVEDAGDIVADAAGATAEAAADAAETVVETAAGVVAGAVETVAGAAETVADVAEGAAEAIAPDDSDPADATERDVDDEAAEPSDADDEAAEPSDADDETQTE